MDLYCINIISKNKERPLYHVNMVTSRFSLGHRPQETKLDLFSNNLHTTRYDDICVDPRVEQSQKIQKQMTFSRHLIQNHI